MKVKLQQQENLAGDPRLAAQGFGKVSREAPPHFDPVRDLEAAAAYFEAHGFVVLSAAISAREVAFLNDFFDSTQAERPEAWGLTEKRKPHHRNQGLIYSQPLLDHPELDPFTRHPRSYPVVSRILGGEEKVRFSEFNFRETPEGAGPGPMNFPDAAGGQPQHPADFRGPWQSHRPRPDPQHRHPGPRPAEPAGRL